MLQPVNCVKLFLSPVLPPELASFFGQVKDLAFPLVAALWSRASQRGPPTMPLRAATACRGHAWALISVSRNRDGTDGRIAYELHGLDDLFGVTSSDTVVSGR